jgi:hypothetical protein
MIESFVELSIILVEAIELAVKFLLIFAITTLTDYFLLSKSS